VAVLPFDALAGGSVHAHRLAVTTQTILAQEAYLSRVADPAAGSGAIEAETEALATAAWSAFQGIEASGGIVESIRTGTLLSEIAAARDQRLADAAASRTKMIGVNAYGAGPGEAREVAPAPARSLVYRRLAEPFE
jgi:methylmalonyl-CoA mutase